MKVESSFYNLQLQQQILHCNKVFQERLVNDREGAQRVFQDQQVEQIQYETRMHYSSDSIKGTKGTKVDVTV